MQSFLEDVIEDLLNQKMILSDLVIVLPSKRAGNLFLKTITRKLQKTIFSPKIFTIEAFVEHISGLQPIPHFEQLFVLYSIYKETMGLEEKEPFSSFCGWANTLLYDFNEIDLHLLDHRQVFDYLRAVQDINHWSSKNQNTDMITSYLSFWKKIHGYYNEFCNTLLQQQKGHSGLIYRKAAEDIEYYIQNNPNLKHVFIGFNALNTAEEQLMQALLAQEGNTVYWDIDKAFIENKNHPAAHFITTYKKDWQYYKKNPLNRISEHYQNPKHFTEIPCSNGISQAKYVGHILSEYTQEQLAKTAVILTDETLLIPILNALPEHITTLNVTMGLPLRMTPIASFFEYLFKLHRNCKAKGFYYKDVIALLHQPQTQLLLKNSKAISNYLIQSNSVYIDYNTLNRIQEEQIQGLDLIFKPWDIPVDDIIGHCLVIIDRMQDSLIASADHIQREYVFGFYKIFNQLQQLNLNYNHIDSLQALYLFYRDALMTERIDLRGNPYQGLQIMGVLESRLLDFETVIMTSVNEGIFPAGKTQNSYLPFDLKIAQGLPTYKEKDAVYAYHFYRLLQRAKNIHLLYTTASDGIGGAEKSRFIMQLAVEKKHKLNLLTGSTTFNTPKIKRYEIQKTPEVLQKIEQIAARGFSPSALATYLRNPRHFYYKYILGIKEQHKIEETIAANTMGTIIHNTLEALFSDYIGAQLTASILDKLLLNVVDEIENQYRSSFKNHQFTQGKNKIIYEVIKRYITNFLTNRKTEIQQGAVYQIVAVESELQTSLAIEGIPFPITIKGKVDLIETSNDQLRIIDYKTGAVSPRNLNITSWEQLLSEQGEFEKAFQVLTYAYLYQKNQPTSLLSAGIVSLKNANTAFIPFSFNKDVEITSETIAQFYQVLEQLIKEICDPKVPFIDSTE